MNETGANPINDALSSFYSDLAFIDSPSDTTNDSHKNPSMSVTEDSMSGKILWYYVVLIVSNISYTAFLQ